MTGQLLKVGALCLGLASIAFRFGWWACHYVNDHIDKFDPRIEKGKHGW
ncbi:hypothetical protein ACFWE3_10780 [Mycobacteriaceae bacterium NPDC060252]